MMSEIVLNKKTTENLLSFFEEIFIAMYFYIPIFFVIIPLSVVTLSKYAPVVI
jgi:hypothetical protein